MYSPATPRLSVESACASTAPTLVWMKKVLLGLKRAATYGVACTSPAPNPRLALPVGTVMPSPTDTSVEASQGVSCSCAATKRSPGPECDWAPSSTYSQGNA